MDFDLSPKLAQELFDGEGGSYHSWSSSGFPMLGKEKVGAGKLVLRPRGFALPHYADSSKIGYVLQGNSFILQGYKLKKRLNSALFKIKEDNSFP